MTTCCLLFSLSLMAISASQEAFAFRSFSLQTNHQNRRRRRSWLPQTPQQQRRSSSLSSPCLEVETSSSSSSLFSSASFESYSSDNPDAHMAVTEMLKDWSNNNKNQSHKSDSTQDHEQQALAFLFVSQHHTERFQEIVKDVSHQLGPQTKLLSLIGGGVVSGGTEVDDASLPSMSLLGGSLPKGAFLETFTVSSEDGEEQVMKCGSFLSSSFVGKQDNDDHSFQMKKFQQRPPSHVIFSDPYCTKIHQVINVLDKTGGGKNNDGQSSPVVAGGVSVPPCMVNSSIALQDKVLPPGSLVGVSLGGTVGLKSIVSQGCRPVGPTFTITRMRANAIAELDSQPAIQQLEQTVEKSSKEDQELVHNFGILGGVIQKQQGETHNIVPREDQQSKAKEDQEEDFLICEVVGFRPQSGAFLVSSGHNLKEGDSFRFHVRAADAALDDMQLMIQRAQTEQLVWGSQVMGRPLGALQISCVARGKSLYGRPNVDVEMVQQLFASSAQTNVVSDENLVKGKEEEDDTSARGGTRTPPIAGFFANGEIGPVGIRMGASSTNGPEATTTKSSSSSSTGNTHIHGFSTVVAMLCDYSGIASLQEQEETQYHALMGSGAIVPPQLQQEIHVALLGSTSHKKGAKNSIAGRTAMEDAPWG